LLQNGSERVLLVDRFQPTRDARARILREHGIDVSTAESLDEARAFFQAGRYDLVLLDLHRYPPAEVLVLCRVIKNIDPTQRIALLIGAPSHITLDWQKELARVGDPSQHLRPKAKRHAAAA
jgi:DNA-binding response OmpR family regulator